MIPLVLLTLHLLLLVKIYINKNGLLTGVVWAIALSHAYCILFVSLSHLFLGKINLNLITGGMLSISLYSYLSYNKRGADTKIHHMSTYLLVALIVVVGVFIYGIAFNAIRFLPHDESIPIIGTNDDNANHMAYAAISLKEEGLMFHSKIIRQMSDDSISTLATGWYPYGLYSNINVWYASIRDFFGWKKPLELGSFFSFNAIYHPLMFMALLTLVFYLSDRLYRVKSIYSMPLLISIGLLVISNQFFLKLLVYGFHSQLLAYVLLLALILSVHEQENMHKYSAIYFLNISVLVFAVGATYYYYIPLTLLIVLFSQKKDAPFPFFALPYVAWLLSLVPLFYFSTFLSISTQFQSYGVAFVSFSGLLLCLLCIPVGFFTKQLNNALRKILFILFAVTIIQMVLSANTLFVATNNLSYYFFKSYWTLGLFALPILLAVIGIVGDTIATVGKKVATTGMVIAVIFTSVLFFSVYNQRDFDYNGYDLNLLIHNGNVNYFSSGIQKKWINTYRSVSPANNDIGKKVYAPGLWGHWILAYALFGDSPPVFKKLSLSGLINQSKIRYQSVTEAIINDVIDEKKPIVLDTILNLYVNEKLIELHINNP